MADSLPSRRLTLAGNEMVATEKELAAYITMFEGALIRGSSDTINKAHQAAHDALDKHLQAKSAMWAIAKSDNGL